jgi:protein involved in polysaccharide export with SLBB domain
VAFGPADVVRVHVAAHPDLSTPPEGTPLDDTGALHLPLVGRLELAGCDVAAANLRVTEAFARYLRHPHVAVAVLQRPARVFHAVGHVREPGRKDLTGPTTALEALARAGTFLPGADRQHVFLLRPHGERLEVHTFDGETPDARALVAVAPGDILLVRRTGNQDFQEDLLPILSGLGLSALYVSGRPLLE